VAVGEGARLGTGAGAGGGEVGAVALVDPGDVGDGAGSAAGGAVGVAGDVVGDSEAGAAQAPVNIVIKISSNKENLFILPTFL